jgi:cell wall-associated NlpC family hydrolase
MKRIVRRLLIAALAVLTMSGFVVAAAVQADPAADALAKLNELFRQAEQTTEAMYSAQLNLDAKLAEQKAADDKHAANQVALDSTRARLATLQASADKIAAMTYMGGGTGGLTAALTASSPQHLIDRLSVQNMMATEMTAQMVDFRETTAQAATAAEASAKSAAAAQTAAQQAAAVRAELQAKQSRLQAQIAAVEAQHAALTPEQRTALADPGPPPPPLPVNAPPTDPAIVAMTPSVPSSGNAAVVQAALTRVGAPYVWGATGPDAFDCSGLIKWAFLQTGRSLPRSSQALATGGQPIAESDVQPGDIVTFYSDASHAGIYIGDGMMVHSSTFGTPVRVAPISSAPIYNVRRY